MRRVNRYRTNMRPTLKSSCYPPGRGPKIRAHGLMGPVGPMGPMGLMGPAGPGHARARPGLEIYDPENAWPSMAPNGQESVGFKI